ncbi:hypothetical protein PO878_15465 [Iamia majanohamensis]|uniref:Uncharacterized protein n=1 Tax=Iamia majanohamensis TaxID=467976 RepID=A0AAF0BR31_9ACTN|nr:hypothetical protein [Iamia majanohamensis]WCO65901.1 hypothetical protein PO878_15465 [Iamia majanohamensis]
MGRGLLAHPLLVVGVVAGLVALGHAVWIWTHRQVGAIDPDEAGYLAAALRYQQALGWTQPLALPLEVAKTGTGPLVPLLSVPLLLVGPDDPRTAMLVQPLLLAFTAVAVAGIARRLAGAPAAIVAGVVVLGLPTVASATVSYWLGLGAAAGLAGAMWALVASDRLTNRWAWAFGLGVAAMLLARTMTVGYLPAVAVAGLVVAGRRRESLVGLAQAAGVTVLVAGPWYLAQRQAVFGYLFSYGYGDRSELFGERDLSDRLGARLDRFDAGIGVGVWWGAAVLVVAVVSWALLRRRPPDAVRSHLALGAVVVLGFAALMSTANAGVWFELPVVVVLVPLVVGLGAAAPVAVRAVALVPVVVAAVLQLACTWWVIPPDGRDVPFVDAQGRVAHYEYGFEQYDPRFGPSRRDDLEEAAADWWAVSTAVEDRLRALGDPEGFVVTLSGNFQLFNANTVQLAGQLDGWTPRTWIPDTVRPEDERAADLTPAARTPDGGLVTDGQGRPVERVLLLALHDQTLFTPDAEVRAFARQARAAGWQPTASWDLPGGGEVVLLRHPDGP